MNKQLIINTPVYMNKLKYNSKKKSLKWIYSQYKRSLYSKLTFIKNGQYNQLKQYQTSLLDEML